MVSFFIGFAIDANAISLWHENPNKINTSLVSLQVTKDIADYNLEEILSPFSTSYNIEETKNVKLSGKSLSWKINKQNDIQKAKPLSLKLQECQDEFAFLNEIIPFYSSISLLNNRYGYGIGFKLFD